MDSKHEDSIILTLDAGGTNFVFSAMQGNKEITDPLVLPSNAHDRQKCIASFFDGFERIQKKLEAKASAISFGLPGPTDQQTGIVGKLANLPAFKGGVPLGPLLQHQFKIPVFINNDANLFAYGEAIYGFLPELNKALKAEGINKRFNNLVGITLGTGFGAGIVSNNELISGDNFMAGEVWLLRNRLNPEMFAEEAISIRAVKRFYANIIGIELHEAPQPHEIFDIARGSAEGNTQAARQAFASLGTALGDALGNILTVIDGAVVIGGGIAGAMPFIMPSLKAEISSAYISYDKKPQARLSQKVFYIADELEKSQFLNWPVKQINTSASDESFPYFEEARIPIGISALDTSQRIASGAYAYAIRKLSQTS